MARRAGVLCMAVLALVLGGCAGARQGATDVATTQSEDRPDAVSGATRPGQSVVGSVTSDYALLDEPLPRQADLGADAVLTLVRWSNNLSYGMANVAPPGTQAVVLVPTVCAEATTDVRVLRAAARLCAEIWSQPDILVLIPGEGRIPAAYTGLVGEPGAADGVRLVPVAGEPVRALPCMTGLTRRACDVPEPLALADAVVVVPALWLDERGRYHGALDALAALSPQPLASDSARVDWVSAVDPLYVFADALRPLAGGQRLAFNAVLASDDPCALDMVGAQFLGARPSDVPALQLAAQHALGKAAWRDVAVNGVPVPKLGKRRGAAP